ncbi:hypothetical protein LX16_0198 [Stackebrandtia albiflava]|uniref:Uncharacterized protein n=1 Tax=Stackebrandtia albiflava TaxID=406432 RepID=A0A562V9G6_9ACTN|nr:hypothetical protein [Stackebrandtia albiflava]TWJ14513.1 hypothetical protein LX16_0198 [Stackebrandtia albiflava]
MRMRHAATAAREVTTAIAGGAGAAGTLGGITPRYGGGRRPDRDLVRLRRRWRRMSADGTARDENVFLTAGLRVLGHDARLVLGRETSPAEGDGRYITWVTVDGETLSTGLPVSVRYTPLVEIPESAGGPPDGVAGVDRRAAVSPGVAGAGRDRPVGPPR